MAGAAIVSAVVMAERSPFRHRPARPGDPLRRGSCDLAGPSPGSWMPRSGRGMTAECGGADRPTVSFRDAFSAGLKLRNGVGTNRGRIADSPRNPVPFPATCRGTGAGCALDGVLAGRTSGGGGPKSVKLGTAPSRIRIGEESNGFPETGDARRRCAKTTPCKVKMATGWRTV